MMERYRFLDALTGATISHDVQTDDVFIDEGDGILPKCTSLYFPGCSMINYATPLLKAVYETLTEAGQVDGISLLCCGKILSYEPDGQELRDSFESQLRDCLALTSIKRIVCSCPNCVKALRDALSTDPRTKDIEIAVLPKVLVNLGYRLDPKVCAKLIKNDADAPVMLCPHDSCPDRETGEFADALREMIPVGMWRDPEHCRKRSVCCGSLPRAAGKFEQADKCADLNGREAVDIEADAIVTPCMSCSFQLNMAQNHIEAIHLLELLYNWRIDWSRVGGWMKLRFLFDETLGAIPESSDSGRKFAEIGSATPTVSDEAAIDATGADKISSQGVSISNSDVSEIGI